MKNLSWLTLTVTQRENGMVTRTRTKASMVRSMAQTPGPSGSAARENDKQCGSEGGKRRVR